MNAAHRTPLPYVLGHIDIDRDDLVQGWFFDLKAKGALEKFRVIQNDVEIENVTYGIPRNDVSEFYRDKHGIFTKCGFQVRLDPKVKGSILFQSLQDGIWVTLKTAGKPILALNKKPPQLIVVDNFYTNPDEVRKYALKQEFVTTIASHKGSRTVADFANDDIKARFEELLGVPITRWDYKWNGCFQFCTAEDPLVVHVDKQKYAAIVFLSPDAPPSTGTDFLRKKGTHERYYAGNTFDGGFYDQTPFELVDKIGNVYNRLVIFDARLIHAASQYFGTSKENGRLFQIFFFDI